jgi:hypothetical protein
MTVGRIEISPVFDGERRRGDFFVSNDVDRFPLRVAGSPVGGGFVRDVGGDAVC